MYGTNIIALAFLAALLFLPVNAVAIGISPVYREIFFEPGLNESFYFIMIGKKEGDLLARPYVDGDLVNYTTVPDQAYLIPEGMGVSFIANVELPDSLPPGKHVIRVGVMEEIVSGSGGAQGIAARLGVESLLAVRVPYPSKYLEMRAAVRDESKPPLK